ncbi:hypothetical protein PV-S19_0261 [Pacmanvirus S19]|nr:hypothetical protein PV-S19_0261 [Pacmanvirus S19]
MQSVLISADEARKIYLENKPKYSQRKITNVENAVSVVIENAIQTKPHEFGVLLTSNLFPNFSIQNHIANQLKDLGYFISDRFDHIYVSWALSHYKPSTVVHNCLESAETQYKKCTELIQKRHDEEIEYILLEINDKINHELTHGTHGKKISIFINQDILKYIVPYLTEKNYKLTASKEDGSLVLKLFILW